MPDEAAPTLRPDAGKPATAPTPTAAPTSDAGRPATPPRWRIPTDPPPV